VAGTDIHRSIDGLDSFSAEFARWCDEGSHLGIKLLI